MVNAAAWSWPQWMMLAILAIHLLVVAGRHGKPVADPTTGAAKLYDVRDAIIRVALISFVLAAGGFFR